MVTVSTSRPFSELDGADAYAFGHGDAEVGDVRVESAVEDGEEEESEGGEGGEDGEEHELLGSVRSIRSFESMMSERGGKKRRAREAREVGRGGSSLTTRTRTTGSGPRKSLSDRLAHMSALAGIKVSV